MLLGCVQGLSQNSEGFAIILVMVLPYGISFSQPRKISLSSQPLLNRQL